MEGLKIEKGRTYEISKRTFDILAAAIGMILFSPLFLVISVIIEVSSPGPVLYKAKRSGRYGKCFNIYKFRTMVVGADKGPGTTSQNDSRVTPIGKVLRKYKLDELPQLINVLTGDMSFVGPRPELPRYTDRYKDKELLILSVRPGITDYSSVYFSNLNSLIKDDDPDKYFEENILAEKNALRIQYVERRSFFEDIRLIFVTLFKIIKM